MPYGALAAPLILCSLPFAPINHSVSIRIYLIKKYVIFMENTVVALHHKAQEEAARPAATRRPWWLYAVGLAVLSGAGWYFWYRIRNKSERERITERGSESESR